MADGGGRPATRIQRERRAEILGAALEVFSQGGMKGATVGGIASAAGMSGPKLLYYFGSKDALYREVLGEVIRLWRGPLEAIDAAGEPVDEIVGYVRRKLVMSRDHPRESRLFAAEILAGIPLARDEIFAPLKGVFEEKVALIADWGAAGRIAPVDPHHLMYSIWATTQHYADFEAQIAELSPAKMPTLVADAEGFLVPLYRRVLAPASGGAPLDRAAPPAEPIPVEDA